MRCDDPVSFNSVAPPAVMSTLTLDSVLSYVGTDTSNSNKAYRYSFTYQDTPYITNYNDPYTFVQSAAAGEHLLTQITPKMYQAGTAFARPPVVFGYASGLRDSYRDPSVEAVGGSQQFSGQTFWSYLNFYEDLHTGVGASISYGTARANMSGTPYITDSSGNVTDDRFDPLYCAKNEIGRAHV